jgi:hypothetical protein
MYAARADIKKTMKIREYVKKKNISNKGVFK